MKVYGSVYQGVCRGAGAGVVRFIGDEVYSVLTMMFSKELNYKLGIKLYL